MKACWEKSPLYNMECGGLPPLLTRELAPVAHQCKQTTHIYICLRRQAAVDKSGGKPPHSILETVEALRVVNAIEGG